MKNNRKYMILLDMDEVLCDFVGGALTIHGWTWEQFEQKTQPGRWGLPELLGLSKADFWMPINRMGSQFWTDLVPMPWLYDLIALIEPICLEWKIVTTPSRHPSSAAGKLQWMERYLRTHNQKYDLTNDKSGLANENTILIDDRETTVREFIAAGGHGIVFPARHNSLLQHRYNPLPYVKRQLEAFNRCT